MEVNMVPRMYDLSEGGHIDDEAAALIADALAGDRSPEVPETVLSHVETCVDCKDKIIDVVTFLRNPDYTGIEARKRKTGGHGRMFYIGRIAAVFVLFALFIGVYFLIDKNPSVIREYITDSPRPSGQKQEAPAQNTGQKMTSPIAPEQNKKHNGQSPQSPFRVNSNLENMIGSQLRGIPFDVLTPRNNQDIEPPIHFSWEKEIVTPYTLEIVNNKNKILYSYTVTGKSFDFKEKLSPGLYYWKIESKNELVYVGKFLLSH